MRDIERLYNNGKKKDGVYDRFVKNNPNVASRMFSPSQMPTEGAKRNEETYVDYADEMSKKRSRAIDQFLQQNPLPTKETNVAPHPSTKNNEFLQKNLTKPVVSGASEKASPITVGANDRLAMALTGKPSEAQQRAAEKALAPYEQQKREAQSKYFADKDISEKPVSTMTEEEKQAVRDEYEAIPERNVAQRMANQGVRAEADLYNFNLPENYGDYGGDYERKQALYPNYREIKNEDAYKALLAHGMTVEDIEAINGDPVSEEEAKQLQMKGMTDADIEALSEERVNAQLAAREKLEKLVNSIDESWGVTAEDITNMFEDRYANPEIQKEALRSPVGSSVYTLMSNPFESTYSALSNAYNYATGKPIRDYNTGTDLIRNTITENIDNQFGRTLYGGAMSIGDMAVAAGAAYATGGGSIVSAGIQALEKASQVMDEGVERNLTPDQIFAEGIASAVTTYVTEKIPMGKLEDIAEKGLTTYTKKEIGKVLGAMFLTEGLQEASEDVADWAMDYIVAEDNNQFNADVQNYINQGMDRKEAVVKVIADRFTEATTDFVIGGIGGGVMGAGASALAYGTGKINNSPSVMTDKVMDSEKALGAMIDAVNSIDTTNMTGEDLERVEHAKEVANKETQTKEDIVDMANVLNEQASPENDLADTINQINYQASYDQNVKEYSETQQITPKEYETDIEKAARKDVESIVVQAKKEEEALRRQQEKELLDYHIKGLKSKLGESLNNIAQDFENEYAAKTFLENYNDQNPVLYSEVSLQAYRAGESGQSFDTFLNNSVETKVMLENGISEAYLKKLFYQGQNTRTEEAEEVKLAKNPNRGLATYTEDNKEDALADLKAKVAKKLGVEVATDFTDAVERGNFSAALAKITVNATSDSQYAALVHEMFEFARAYNPKGMALADKTLVNMIVSKSNERSFVDAVNRYKEAYREAGKNAPEGSSLRNEANKTVAEATEEFVNDAISYIFSSEEGMKTFVNYIMSDNETTQKEKVSVIQTIKDWIDHLIQTIKNFVSGNKSKQLGYQYAEEVGFSTEELEKLSRFLVGVLDEAKTNLANMTETSGKAEGETAHSVEVEAGVYGGDQDMRFSIATYADATINGRDYLKEYLKKYSGLSKKDQKDIIDTLEWGYEIAKEMADGKYKSFSNWSNTRLETDDAGTPLLETFNSEGRPIRSVVVNNGEYPLNIDFSQVCKKRIALNNVLNQLVTDADLNLAVLTESDIAGINNLIKEHQFEIACGLCFVDSKRYRVGAWADSFVNGKTNDKTHKKESLGWNDLVMSMLKKGVSADYFNLASSHVTPLGTLLKNATDDQIDFTTLDKVIKPYLNKKGTLGSATEEAKMAYLLKTDPASRMYLDKNDIIASEGLDALRAKYQNVYTLVNSHEGSARPKLSHGFTAYGNEILRAESWKSEKNQFNKEDAYAVGGVRVQSFSDYVANLFFDYMQMFADMSARQLPSHAYTKEATYARLFGMTGQRINMSLIFKGANLTKEQSERLAKLLAKGRKYVLADEEFGELCDRAGLDENGDYIFEDESFDFEEAKAIQNDPRYKYCGTIGVGLSNRHIRKMLSDPDIKMVIPYHASGVSQLIKNARNLALYTDYTSVQHTRGKNGKNLKREPFDWYERLKSEANPKGLDAKKVADEYLKFCDKNGYIPKFDAFRDHPNYYKLLIDFRAYDNDGKFMPQTAVKMNFPEEAEFKKLVSDSLKAQQETEDRMEKEMSGEQKSLYKEVKDFLKHQGTLTETDDIRHSIQVLPDGGQVHSLPVTMDSEGRSLSEGQQKYFKNSAIRDENGNLKVMYHGTTKGGFVVFDPSFSDDKLSLFFADNKDVAKSYSEDEYTHKFDPYKETKPIKTFEDAKEFLESEGFTDISYFEETVYGKKIKMWSFTSPEFGRSRGMSDKKFVEYAEAVRTSKDRYYETYLNIENPLTVNAEGRYWNRLQGFRLGYEDGSIKVIDISFVKKDGKYRVISDYIDNQGIWSYEDIVDTFGEEFAEIVKNAPETVTFDNLFVNFASKVCLPNGTRTAAVMAKYSGKDGVVIENVKDFAGGFNKKKHAPCMIAIAFDSNQVKSIYNENPTEDPDIRHSIDIQDDAFFESFQEIENEVKLDESDLEKFIKEKMDLDSEVAEKTVKDIAKTIKKQYNSNIKTDRLAGDIMSVFKYLKSTGNISMNDVMFVMKDIARPVLENVKSSDPIQEKRYKDFIDFIKGYRIALDAGQMAEVAHSFGSYYEFQRAMRGKINLAKDGMLLDNIWTEIADKSEGALSYGTNPNDQPLALAEYIHGLTPSYETMDGQTMDDAATDLALEIFRQFYVYQSMADAANKVKGELNRRSTEYKNKYKKAYNDAVKQVELERNLNIQRLANEIDDLTAEEQEAIRTGDTLNKVMIENLKNDYIKRLERLKAETDNKIVQAKAKYQNAWITKNLRRERSELKNRVLREVKALQNLIAHPSEGATKHVPINLIKPTIEMLEAINLDNGGRNKAIAERLKKMAEVYESFKGEEYSFDYDERIANDIKELKEIFENKSYADLEIRELERVIEVVTALKTQIKNANNLILQGKLKDAKEAASSAMSAVANSRRHDNAAMNVLNRYGNIHLNAYRLFRKLSGYKDSALMDIYEDLDEGSKKEMQIQKDLGQIFQSVLEGSKNQKEVKKFISTKKEDLVDIGITDKDGKPIKITRAMRMSLIMHSMNASNMRHVLGSGITVPNMYYFEKGKMDEAYAKGTNYRFVDYATLLDAIQKNDMNKVKELTEEAQKKIEALKDDLSDWEKDFLAAAEEMFHEKTGKYINETSLALKGYAIARVKNYFPIKTDAHFTTQEWAGLVQNGSLEGSGVLKERVVSTKPILLEDITNVIERQIRFTSKYAGLAIAVRNFETIMKQTTRDDKGKLRNLYETIDSVWGASDTKWLKNLMQDIQGGRSEAKSWLMNLRGQFAGATLTMNPGVAIKQAASYPTAAAVVGYKALGRAMADMRKGFITQEGIKELEEINPLLWYRNQGNGTQELADAKAVGFGKNLPLWMQKAINWTQWFDTGTVRTLEYASKYYVDDQFPKLEKGSEEYWQKVSEVFTNVVEQTQPNYSTLHKADIIRNPNSFVKMLVMFKTQPMQNFGIIYDAMGELNAAKISGNKKWINEASSKAALAVSSQAVSATVFSAMSILAQLLLHRWYKYKDDEKWSWEKFWLALGEGALSCFTGAFIGGSELYEALKHIFTGSTYYGIEVSVAEMVTDFVKSIGNMVDGGKDLWNAKTSEDKEKSLQSLLKSSINLGSTVGEFKGTPVNNIKNMLSSMYFYATDIIDSIDKGELTFSDKSNIATWEVETQYERIYQALNDPERYDKLVNELKDKVKAENPDLTEEEVAEKVEKNVTTKITQLMKEAYLEGDVSYDEMSDYLEEKKGKTEDEAFFQIREWETGESTYGVMKNTISEAAENPTPETRKAVIDEINVLLEHGKDKSDISSTITKNFKEEYINLYNQDKAANLNAILRTAFVTAGYTDEQAKKKLSDWLK